METPETLEVSATKESAGLTPEEEAKFEKYGLVGEIKTVKARAQTAEEKAAAYEARLAEYESRDAEAKRAQMSEIDLLRSDLEKTTQERDSFKITHFRNQGIDEEISTLGDGWIVDRDAVASILGDIPFDEKTDREKIKKVIDNTKKPMMGGQSPIRGNMPLPKSDGSDDDALDFEGQALSPAQVLKLSPSQYKRWLASQTKNRN